ncbi:hypothetical protein [Saccharothrix sp. HUAS TT1]|uniref:hypothetical protein n=1 Tax=unclassified Saccharothrix TaxID=2593673 RepID=UPI00345B7A42
MRHTDRSEDPGATPGGPALPELVRDLTEIDPRTVAPEQLAQWLTMLPRLRAALDAAEVASLEALLDGGWRWQEVADRVYEGISRQSTQDRYRRLGGTLSWPAGRPPVPDPVVPRRRPTTPRRGTER